jgi:hypothetical protein
MDRLFPSIALAAVFLLNKREREREKMKTKTIDKRSRRGTGPISTSHPDSVPESKSSWPLAACLPASYSLAKGIESMFFLLFFPLHNTHTDSIYGLAHKFSWLKTSETEYEKHETIDFALSQSCLTLNNNIISYPTVFLLSNEATMLNETSKKGWISHGTKRKMKEKGTTKKTKNTRILL